MGSTWHRYSVSFSFVSSTSSSSLQQHNRPPNAHIPLETKIPTVSFGSLFYRQENRVCIFKEKCQVQGIKKMVEVLGVKKAGVKSGPGCVALHVDSPQLPPAFTEHHLCSQKGSLSGPSHTFQYPE